MKFRDYMRECARSYWEALLDEHGDNVSEATRVADISRTAFYAMAKRHGVKLRGKQHTGNEAWRALGH